MQSGYLYILLIFVFAVLLTDLFFFNKSIGNARLVCVCVCVCGGGGGGGGGMSALN